MIMLPHSIIDLFSSSPITDWAKIARKAKVSIWDVLIHHNLEVYTPYGDLMTLNSCSLCGTLMKTKVRADRFVAAKTCKCGHDGTHNYSLAKMMPYYTSPDLAATRYKSLNANRTRLLPNKVQYWIDQGLTTEEADIKVTATQTERSAKSPSSKPGVTEYSVRCADYWVKRGLTVYEAAEKVKEYQTHNGLNWYINRFGDAGPAMYEDRMSRWLSSTGMKKVSSGRSKVSTQLFDALSISGACYNMDEKTIKGATKMHRADFLYHNIIIEFYGDYWHGNPNKFHANSLVHKKLVSDIWISDAEKVEDLVSVGYSVLVVWETEFRKSPNETIEKCKRFIDDNINI